MEVLITEKEICGSYPDDIKLNFAVAGDCVIGNFRYSDELVQELLKKAKEGRIQEEIYNLECSKYKETK